MEAGTLGSALRLWCNGKYFYFLFADITSCLQNSLHQVKSSHCILLCHQTAWERQERNVRTEDVRVSGLPREVWRLLSWSLYGLGRLGLVCPCGAAFLVSDSYDC